MERLRSWLDESKVTQSALAEALGVSQPTVCDWVNGNALPRMKKLRELSLYTGISIDELLGGAPKVRPRRTAH